MKRCVLWSWLAAATAAMAVPTAMGADSPFRSDVPQISWEQTRDHYGQECVVYGTVVAARDIGSRCFLNFHANFRENFTVVVTRDNYGKFPERPDLLYNGKHVRVAGQIIEYQGKPEIVLTSPEAIEIIDDPTPPKQPVPSKVPAKGDAPKTDAPKAAAKPDPSPPVRSAAPPAPAANGVVKIAAYNLLNLFDAFDDPYVDNERVEGKDPGEVAKLAEVLRKVGADIVCVEEVENRQVLKKLADDHLKDFGYEVVLIEGNSDRGIDVGLLSRLPIREVTSHRHFDFKDDTGKAMRFQRDLLQVRIAPDGCAPFDVFVVHLKSKYGGAEKSLPLRMGEARETRKLFDEMLARDAQARFVICGDFNDTIESTPLQHLLGSGSTALRTFIEDLPSEQRITYNKGHLSMIDFIFASPAMGAEYVSKSYGVVSGTVESSGSDHNPVFASFKLAAAANTD